MTKRLTRARSNGGWCSGKSGTLSTNSGVTDGAGPDGVLPGCACNRSRPQRRLTAVTPLPMRNCLRVYVGLMFFRVNAVRIANFLLLWTKNTAIARLTDENVV